MNKKQRQIELYTLAFRMADAKGKQAAAACTPTPMIVSQHENMADDNSPVAKQWYVPSGVCGFAWVTIRPANSAVAHFAATLPGWRLDSYSGGIKFWVSDYGQSMETKEAYATAFAKELLAILAPFEPKLRVSADSRMD